MTLSDFGALCRTLFRNEQGKAYAIENKRLREMFDVFDQNKVSFFLLLLFSTQVFLTNNSYLQDGYIGFQEFAFCWKQWIKPVSVAR